MRFLTVVFFAFTPLPFWSIRSVAILDGCTLRRLLIATAVGRFPLLFVNAWLGAAIHFPTGVLVGINFGSAAVVVAMRLMRGQRVLANTVLDGAETPTSEAKDGQPDPALAGGDHAT